jgi:hypothetical protein
VQQALGALLLLLPLLWVTACHLAAALAEVAAV